MTNSGGIHVSHPLKPMISYITCRTW